MKRVLLINTNTEKAPYPVPPVGLAMVASAAGQRYEVRLYDGTFDEGRNLVRIVEDFGPDYIGIGIRNIDDTVMERPVSYIARILSDFILPVKKISTAPLILGGSGFSIFPEELMKLTGADYGVAGEGEEIFPALLGHLDSGKDHPPLPKIIYPGIILPGKRGFPSAEIDRHIDYTPYRQKSAYPIQTKRGCSHRCIYCTYPVIEGKRFRPRDPAEIAGEIEQACHRLGPITFEFVDSTFNDPKGHAEAICREIIKRKIKIRLRTMGINPRHTSRELFELMLEAGFVQIDANPDSASPAMIRNLGKGFHLHEVEKMALLIREFDLPTMWFFLFGGPGENENTLKESFSFIDAYVNPSDLVYLATGLRIYPDTPLYRIALKEGFVRRDQSLLDPASFYFSREMDSRKTAEMMHEFIRLHPNCLPSSETTPSPEMMHEATEIRKNEGLTEPMFRTLLRIRKDWIGKGRLRI